MADSLAKDLTKRVINSLAAITGVRLWSGKEGDTDDDALGVDMSEMITSAKADASNDYQGLTGKGFHASVATTEESGIVELSTEAEVSTETAGKVLTSDMQTAMRLHAGTALNGTNTLGRARSWQQDGIGEDETEPHAFKFTITFNTNKADTTSKVYYPQPFTMPAGKKIHWGVINGAYYGVLIGSIDNTQFTTASGDAVIQMGGSNFQIVVPSDGSLMYISTSLSGQVSCVLDVFAILRDV